MKPVYKFLAVQFALTCLIYSSAGAWGWEAHDIINEAALRILPADMKRAIGPHGQALIDHARDPDLWHHDPDERHRHWIDLELADSAGAPFVNLHREYQDAVAAYGADSLKKIGVLPWRIESYIDTVVNAMQHPSSMMWIKLAALSHYVADAHMPLHTTVNYDGQLTGNRGIHFRFEWWMLDQFRDEVILDPDTPLSIEEPLETAWRMILASHADIDTILAADDAVRAEFRPPVYGEGGRRQRDTEFEARLWQRLGPLAIHRMELSAEAVAGYWYHAWIRAGRPDLSAVPDPPPRPEE